MLRTRTHTHTHTEQALISKFSRSIDLP